MSFAAQVRATLRWGLACMGLSLGLLGVLALTGRTEMAVLPVVVHVGLTAGVALIVFGVVGRIVHRWLWRRMFAASELSVGGRRWRDRVLGGRFAPLWRWWLHLDAQGSDRDGI